MADKVKKESSYKQGRPAAIKKTIYPQVLSIHRCPAILKLQLIKEAEEMDLTLSMYVCMVLQGVGRDVRKAAAMEWAIELEKQNDPTTAFRVTPSQISAFEASLLADPDKEVKEEALMRERMEQERAETEELLSKIAEYEV